MEEMNNKPIKMNAMLVVLLFSITLVAATTIYPGETIIIDNEMGIENLVYTIIGNSTAVGELDLMINSTSIKITFPQDMAPDNFQIIFLEEITKTITQTVNVGGGGGGGRTRTIYKDNNITEYINKEIVKEVPGETIEKEIIKTSKWSWIWFIVFCVTIILILIKTYYDYQQATTVQNYVPTSNSVPNNIDVRRYE